jgi:hypothetical protein
MLKEEDYPMNYQEFRETVLELLFEYYSDEFIEKLKERLDVLEKRDGDFMMGLYKHSCFIYDNPQIYGDTCKREFEKGFLRSGAVHLLRESLGLGMIPWDDL